MKKMKINWGTGIVIAFALFISFILYFVFKVQSNAKYDNELVVEEYYKHDAKFGDEMIRAENAQDLKLKPIITVAAEAISIVFPNTFIPKKIKGKVSLYRPSNKKLDFEIPISLTNTTLLIPKKSLVGGRWDINMEWQYDGKSYLTKEIVYIK
ncbi:putative cytochrome cbb3 oxidase maturation protein CcoH [Flavobacterium psychrophilum]|nr:putative cytochrome cbb3 oxidase maturation protein CcoH [Flavobacterium psychrophilum]SNB06128.1 putative cytochrome cbb3 oxidase maturation protein CcoH [Flavobacterium psychrophilum]SNB18637.1 putative cytochrome cbb3 oxidase maturation protein CcoH [Flavobacterium psychrophilum]SNB33753.1 putative cytochrome cbb3 oxidase maturation protein CcoH [Flavobacterium psychrophilum]